MKAKTYLILFLIVLVFAALSCKKNFEEINTNPQAFMSASDGSLLNGILRSLEPSGNEQFYVHNEILEKQIQQGALYKIAWGNYAIGTEDIWSNYYTILPNFRELQKRIEEYEPSSQVNAMNAMVKTLLAYKTFRVTDYFGDIPYSEAGYGYHDATKLRPKFDAQRDIYISLMNDLKWVEDNLDENATGEPLTSFEKFDNLFGGDLLMWRKFANSLRLRYAIRMYDKEPGIAGPIIAEIINNNKPVLVGSVFGSSPLEMAAFVPADLNFRNEGTYWSFREHNNLRMGTNLWHQMSDNDNTDGSGIFDRRVYYFFETNNAGEWVPYPQFPSSSTPTESGVPYREQREVDGGFLVKGEDNLFSPYNFFLIADIYNVPIIFMSGAEVHFLKAEALLRGMGVAANEGDASDEFLSGVQASYESWKNILENSKLPRGSGFTTHIAVPGNLDLITLQNKVGFWNFSTTEDKLKSLYTQQWIDLFRQPAEAFALTRRVPDKIPREGNALNFFRFTIPASEVQYNSEKYQAAYSGGDFTSSKMWWMN